MTKNSLNDVNWQDSSECAKPENKKISKFFFSNKPEEKYAARNLCFSCDVRRECLKYALDNKQIHGVWGGKEEAEIRRALSVSHTGQEVRRQRFPNCPYCGARPSKLQVLVVDAPDNGRWKTIKLVRCDVCEFTWKSRTSANAVNAYQASRKAKAKTAKPKAKAKAKPKKPSPPSTET
jgi:WhiB family redox-sensing transcriptional regulator